MWGSIFDATKDLAEKARKAAEELEKNLNESAGTAPAVSAPVSVPEEDAMADHADDALNDAWDDDDVEVEEDENEEMDLEEVALTYENDTEDIVPSKIEDTNEVIDHTDDAPVALADEPISTEESPAEVPDPTGMPDGPASADPPHTTLADALVDPVAELPVESMALGVSIAISDVAMNSTDVRPNEDTDTSALFGSMVDSVAPAEAAAANEAPDEEMVSDVPEAEHGPFEASTELAPPSSGEAYILAINKQDDTPSLSVPDVSEDYSKPEDNVVPHPLGVPPLLPGAKVATVVLSHVSSPFENAEMIIESLMSDERTRALLERKFMDSVNEDAVDSQAKMEEIQELLSQREHQLFSKTEQITLMEAMHEKEKEDLLLKIQNTKEEAKRRIQKAKERVDAVESKLKSMSTDQSTSALAQDETIQKQAMMISELREEGEKLARKQADMEAAVRSSKGEARELRTTLEEVEDANSTLTEKLKKLEVDYKTAQHDLQMARQGISQVDQLDSDLRNIREESEKRASTILLLEQEVKELKAANKELHDELNVSRKGAAIETEQERKRLIMEHGRVLSDMEAKLQVCEREAAIREDALRIEIDEIRKRWQDAVRRADALSLDVQASTAPLLRQLESTNKQNRIRATAWAELETQLRNEIETSIAQNETLSRECNEYKTKFTRLERTYKEYESELKQLKNDLYDKTDLIQKLQHQRDELLHERDQLKISYSEIERASNEGVTRVRSEMTRTIVQNEDRYRGHIESMEKQLQEERNQKSVLEQQLQQLLQLGNSNHGFEIEQGDSSGGQQPTFNNDNQQRLRQSEGQVDILADALGHLAGDDNDGDDADEGEILRNNGSTGSYAALEQLTSRLKASKMELKTLRTRLAESEKIRNDLLSVVDESRNAREKLPLFEQRIQELTTENTNLQLEIRGLREDIVDVRELYRTQLNVLLEAQAEAKSNIARDESVEM
jgi:TATA element modulatory factor